MRELNPRKDGSSEFTYQLVQILGEPITVNFWISGPFEQHVRDVGCVLVGYSHDKSHQLLASRLRESADRSKVDKAHILFPDKENIARMRIAMEFAIQNDHAQDCIRILSRERRHAWVGRAGLERRRGRSIQPLLDVDPYPRQFPMNCWSLDPKRVKIATDTLACTSFGCQIHFPGKISAKGSQELYGAIAGDFRGSILGNGGEARQQPHIGLHSRSSARTPHLYDNAGAVEQRSRVGLRYRSRSQWLFIELGEFPSPVSSPACGKDGLDFFEWHRRNLIVERREGSNPGPGKQIAARRQQLSKLYSDRTNVAQECDDRRRPQFTWID